MTAEREHGLERLTNFGGNQQWYSNRYQPASEAEVLQILAEHPGVTIRAIGSGHSWSNIAANTNIVLDMSRLNVVTPIKVDGLELVRVGAGCRLEDLLDRLHAATDRTLPTLGAIKKQTISGAISTGTHGSGRQSLSHFVARVRAVVFNASTGQPEIQEFSGGADLLAARCGLGCMGIIVSVDIHTVPKYMVSETIRIHRTIEDVITSFADNPLSNFLMTPYSWKLVAFERKPVARQAQTTISAVKARVFRIVNLIAIDIVFHLLIIGSRMAGLRAVKGFMKLAPHALALIKDIERLDDSEHVLTMNHQFFRHEEMEIFVREAELPRTLRFLRASIEVFSGIEAAFPDEFLGPLKEAELSDVPAARSGSYVHHYPLFCRRVLPEETMISMTASVDEPLYSISIFTYSAPKRRESYYAFCSFVARVLLKLVGVRLHWGKHFPLQYADVAPLYPRLEEFRALCSAHDRRGVLRNGYTARILNLPPGR